MMPYYQYIEDSSPNSKKPIECRTNGIHKNKTTNGKHSVCDVTSIQKSLSAEGLSEQRRNNFICDTKTLIDLLTLDPKQLEVKEFVERNKGKSIPLDEDYVRLSDLDGTPYRGREYMKKSWENVFLREKTKMQVFGTLESSYEHDTVPWVLLVGEDGCIYAYGDEELKKVGKSLHEFLTAEEREIYETYSRPELSEEEALQEDETTQAIRQQTRDIVNNYADKFDAFPSLVCDI